MSYRITVPTEWRHQWPCSTLAGRTITATLDAHGDLIDLENAPEDCPGDELDAVIETYGESI